MRLFRQQNSEQVSVNRKTRCGEQSFRIRGEWTKLFLPSDVKSSETSQRLCRSRGSVSCAARSEPAQFLSHPFSPSPPEPRAWWEGWRDVTSAGRGEAYQPDEDDAASWAGLPEACISFQVFILRGLTDKCITGISFLIMSQAGGRPPGNSLSQMYFWTKIWNSFLTLIKSCRATNTSPNVTVWFSSKKKKNNNKETKLKRKVITPHIQSLSQVVWGPEQTWSPTPPSSQLFCNQFTMEIRIDHLGLMSCPVEPLSAQKLKTLNTKTSNGNRTTQNAVQ